MKKQFEDSFKEQMKKEAAYLQMSTSELSQLSDDELFGAVWARTENIVSSKEDLSEGFLSLNEKQRVQFHLRQRGGHHARDLSL